MRFSEFIEAHPEHREAIVESSGKSYSYQSLLNTKIQIGELLESNKIGPGDVVGVEGNFSCSIVAALLAIADVGATSLPLLKGDALRDVKVAIASPLIILVATPNDSLELVTNDVASSDEFLAQRAGYLCELKNSRSPGIILYTSGSSGKPKAAVHDLGKLVRPLFRFQGNHVPLNLIGLMSFDHWGGLNTLFSSLITGGTFYCLSDQTPSTVLGTVEKYKLQVISATPTFLAMVLVSGVIQRFNLDSLTLITYGAEPMPESVLRRMKKILPNIKFKQTYGLIEAGVLAVRSSPRDMLAISIDSKLTQWRVKDDMLEIKNDSLLLGYINAASPFTADGWLQTGDRVQLAEDGSLIIIGRESEQVTIGSEKFFPITVEDEILNASPLILGAKVFSERIGILGNKLVADIELPEEVANDKEIFDAVRHALRDHLPKYMVPSQFNRVNPQENPRLKKRRT